MTPCGWASTRQDQLVQVDPDGSVLNKSTYISKRVNNDERTLSAVNSTDGVYIHASRSTAHRTQGYGHET
jgi:hypothetical protein